MDLESQDTASRSRKGLLDTLIVLPIIVAVCYSAFFALWSISARLTKQYPLNPWESAIVADAYRAANGRAVYEVFPEGHATHLYGAFTTYFLGAIFKITGANYFAGRAMNLVSGIAACAILLWIFLQKRRMLDVLLGAGMLIALHYRCRAYFTETRPDVLALFVAIIALICCYRALQLNRMAWIIPGALLVVTAMMFKQTYAAAAAVVPLAAVMAGGWRDVRKLAVACIPLVAIALCGLILWKLFPTVYYYMFKVPSQYTVPKERIFNSTAALITLCPIFFAAALWIALSLNKRVGSDPKIAWLISAIILGSLAGIIAMAKRGGSYNSLLLGWVPMTAFCVYALSPMLDALRDLRVGALSRIAGSCVVGILIAATTFAVPNNDLWAFEGAHGHAMYAEVIQALRKEHVRGTVVCMDDPALMMFAIGEPSRSLDCDLDADGRNKPMPDVVVDYLTSADWVIRVHCNYDDFFVDAKHGPDKMEQLGFTRRIDPVFKRYYSLWERTGEPTIPTSQPTTKRRVNRR